MWLPIFKTKTYARWARKVAKLNQKSMIIKIHKVRSKPFKGEEGDMIPYFWYDGEKQDGLAINFGSKIAGHKVGTQVDVLLQEKTGKDGQTRYTEVTRK